MSATWEAKAWLPAQVCRLFGLLAEQGYSPLVITGPGDQALEEALRQELPAEGFAPPTNLLEMADLLGKLDLFVGTDNGARHLASGLGLPTVTLFGPTDPVGWNPADPRHVVVRNKVPCSPCDLTVCPVAGHPCLEELSAEQVMNAVQKLTERLQTQAQPDRGAEI
jgi:ADP-heptose:LPS heptosyltransferase